MYDFNNGEYAQAHSGYSFLADDQVDIVLDESNELKIIVGQDYTISGYINDILISSIAINDLKLDAEEMS